MRLRVSSLTVGLPRNARDTVDCETPARYATSIDVALAVMHSIMCRDASHRQFDFLQFTVTLTGADAMPLATTLSELAPASVAIETSNKVETMVLPVATPMLLWLWVRA